MYLYTIVALNLCVLNEKNKKREKKRNEKKNFPPGNVNVICKRFFFLLFPFFSVFLSCFISINRFRNQICFITMPAIKEYEIELCMMKTKNNT